LNKLCGSKMENYKSDALLNANLQQCSAHNN
jgi:hypothetical protein